MVSGTYVLTDSIDKAFDSIFNDVRAGLERRHHGQDGVRPLGRQRRHRAHPSTSRCSTAFGRCPMWRRRRAASTARTTQLIDDDGDAVVYGGAPNLGFSIANGDSRFNPLTLVEGTWPGPNEVVVDKSTAGKEDFEVGETIGVQAEGPVAAAAGLRASSSSARCRRSGARRSSGFDLPTAQRLFGKEGKLDEIAVAAKPGVSDQQLIEEIERILPADTQVRSGQAQAAEDASETDEFISFLQNFLLAFAGVALFVGSFVIANSLSITIAQRTREFATLRTLGASRRQVLGSVIVEALVVGTIASLIGLFLGLALARGLFELFDVVGFTLPNSGLVFGTRTIVVALLVGILVTLLASLRPAVRATRVPPIAAVREGATIPEGRFARYRTPGSALLAALGFAGLLYGLFGPGLSTTEVLLLMLGGTLLIFIGIALLSVRFIRPLAGLLGWPATKIGGAAGELAQGNARRNPQRTASTAAALMIGLALVTLVAVLAAGIVSTFRSAVNELFVADYAITAQNNYSPIPTDISAAAAKAPGVTAIGSVRTGEAQVFGDVVFVDGRHARDARGDRHDLEGGVAGRPLFARTQRRLRRRRLRRRPRPEGRLAGAADVRRTARSRRSGSTAIFDPPTGGSPFGSVTISARRGTATSSSRRTSTRS